MGQPLHVRDRLRDGLAGRFRQEEERNHGRDGQCPDDEVRQPGVDQGQKINEEGSDGGPELRAGVQHAVGPVTDGSRKDFFGEKADSQEVNAAHGLAQDDEDWSGPKGGLREGHDEHAQNAADRKGHDHACDSAELKKRLVFKG